MPQFNVYATGHEISNIVCAAFAEGFDGRIVPPNRLLEGPAAMYGILRGTGEIIHQCQWINRDFYYIDHGYFRRGHYEGFYRITKNALQQHVLGPAPDDRFRSIEENVRPWKRTGKSILVIPLTDAVGVFRGVDSAQWENAVVNEISLHTDREIRIKKKHEGDLKKELEDCWCVVTHSSNTAIVALLQGIPVITLGESAAAPVSWKFEHIENPWWPDREPLFHWLAYQQFTLDEMRDGTARRLL